MDPHAETCSSNSPRIARLSAVALDTETEKRSDTFTADLARRSPRGRPRWKPNCRAAILASADDEVEVETRESPEARELADLIERGRHRRLSLTGLWNTGRLPDGADRRTPAALQPARQPSPAERCCNAGDVGDLETAD